MSKSGVSGVRSCRDAAEGHKRDDQDEPDDEGCEQHY
jgi:hypothetical protein